MEEVVQKDPQHFLLSIDREMKVVKEYMMLDKGSELLDRINQWEEENGKLLTENTQLQEALEKRKILIRFLIFPLLSDEEIEELLQYHTLDAIQANLDLEELMNMRAVTASEFIWPQVSQKYIRSLMQNSQLLGSDLLIINGEKSNYLPYVKNWISTYNRKFGIEKHEGLEPHKFVISNINAKRLSKNLKEHLLKLLKFYEGLKVYSLSEIETQLIKVKQESPQKIPTKSDIPEPPKKVIQKPPVPKKLELKAVSKKITANETPKPPAPKKPDIPEPPKKVIQKPPVPKKLELKAVPKKITVNKTPEPKKEIVKPPALKINEAIPKGNIEKLPLTELLNTYPHLGSYKISSSPINNPGAPFSLAPTVQNWINHYQKERGKGTHTFNERSEFIESMQRLNGLSSEEKENLKNILLSVDEKIPLPYDKKENKLLLDKISVGQKLKPQKEEVKKAEKPKQVISAPLAKSDQKEYESEFEFVPGGKEE